MELPLKAKFQVPPYPYLSPTRHLYGRLVVTSRLMLRFFSLQRSASDVEDNFLMRPAFFPYKERRVTSSDEVIY